jgi:hypothetical protein
MKDTISKVQFGFRHTFSSFQREFGISMHNTNNFDSLAPNARGLEFRKQAITPD